MTPLARALCCLSILLFLVAPAPAYAQAPGAAAGGQAVSEFLKSAYSSALLQLKAAEITAGRDVRPEAKQFAQEMIPFRQNQLQRIETLAGPNQAVLPKSLAFEQQILIDNLRPLDFLALSRRYAELQVQALEQEANAYEAASGNAAAAPLTGEYIALLRQQLDRARGVKNAVGP
jgi:putative membrane protein